MKKLVEREHLNFLYCELQFLKDECPADIQDRLENLLNYMEENIIQKDNEYKNELKRAIYKRMKAATTEEENKRWHDFYKSID